MRSPIIWLFIIITILLNACGSGKETIIESPKSDTTDIVHFNFIIGPDLSNRVDQSIYPKPVNDLDITKQLLSKLESILKYRRSEGQRDVYNLSFINKGLINMYDVDMSKLTLNFGTFENQKNRIDYIKDRSPAKLSVDKKTFLEEYQRIIQASIDQTHGADLWSYFNTGLNSLVVRKDEEIISYNGKYYRHKFRNILILLTDGYLEAELYGDEGCVSKKLCYYLSGQRVKSFRQAFKNSQTGDVKEFFDDEGYGIVPVNNPNLKDLEVLVMEMYDRSLSSSGSARVHPTDEEVLKVFWSDWLDKSGVKRFELHKTVTTIEEAKTVIFDFVGID
ncbi:MAG: hypothetical protein RJQ14_08645 [Marinoscillum sp.]